MINCFIYIDDCAENKTNNEIQLMSLNIEQ